MKPTNFTPAKYVDCGYLTDMGGYAHSMIDHCYDCAPFWARVPLCPTDNRKLTTHGFCRTCRHHYNLVDVEANQGETLREYLADLDKGIGIVRTS